MSSFFPFKKAQALIELLVAFGIASIILTSTSTLLLDIQTANLVSRQYTHAQDLMEEVVTAILTVRRRSFSELESAPVFSHPEIIASRYELREGTGLSSIYTVSIEKKEVRRDETGQIIEEGGVVDPNVLAFQITISWNVPRPRSLQRIIYSGRDFPNQSWIQTTQADFQAGTLINTTADEYIGDVVLDISSIIFIERFHTETYKDGVPTTAVWDIEAHQLRLPTDQRTWIAQTSPISADLNEIFCVDNEHCFTVGKSQASRATIITTSDGGDTWVDRSSDVTTAELTAVYFINQTTGIAVGKTGTIIRTTDEGLTWSLIPSPLQSNLEGVWFVDDLVGVAVGASGTVLRTEDGGLTWNSISIGTTDQLNAIYFINATTGYVVGNNGLIYKTEDAGATWTLKSSTSGRHLNAVFFSDELNGYAVGNNGIIIHTPDGGETWESQNSRTSKHLFAVWFVGDDGWAAGDNGTLATTVDGGENWRVDTDIGTTKNLRGLHFESYDVGWLTGFNGEIRKFQPHYVSPATAQSIKVNSTLAEITRATLITDMVLGDWGGVTFYLSANGGANWEEVSPDTPHTFAYPGNDLRWKAVLSTSNLTKTPVVYKVQINVGGGYNPTGTFESQLFDGGKRVGFNHLHWYPEDLLEGDPVPEGTDLTFQVAVSDNPAGPFNFVGPDGTTTSFYDAESSKAFWYTVAAGRYLKVKAYLSTEDSAITPRLEAFSVNYSP